MVGNSDSCEFLSRQRYRPCRFVANCKPVAVGLLEIWGYLLHVKYLNYLFLNNYVSLCINWQVFPRLVTISGIVWHDIDPIKFG